MKYLLESLNNNFDSLEELNSTGNMDGGEGPIKTPGAFKKTNGTNPDEDADHDSIEVFDYKKSKVKHIHFESTYGKMAAMLLGRNESI